MEIKITDTILYTQLLTRAGFQVHAITGASATRGSGTRVLGAFTYADGSKRTEVMVKATKTQVMIDGVTHDVLIHDGGTFDLFPVV